MTKMLRKILWFFWPTTKEMKRRMESNVSKNDNPPPIPGSGPSVTIYVDGKPIAIATTFRMNISDEPVTFKPERPLQEQLNEAIDSEDYERAAVLRDKINQANP
jgi:hypothetical protein